MQFRHLTNILKRFPHIRPIRLVCVIADLLSLSDELSGICVVVTVKWHWLET